MHVSSAIHNLKPRFTFYCELLVESRYCTTYRMTFLPQYSLRAPGHLDDPIVMVELDTSNGGMFPMYDPDANLIYLCGKVSMKLCKDVTGQLG